tara:strand:- start:1008 stop:1184 length:177 start_codon:yes stop_codon:yes gene_type:complete
MEMEILNVEKLLERQLDLLEIKKQKIQEHLTQIKHQKRFKPFAEQAILEAYQEVQNDL